MSIHISRGDSDPILEQMVEALRAYEANHPHSRIDLYRLNPVSVRIRIIDPDLAGLSRVDRNDNVWKYLDALSDEAQADLSSLVLITPEETARSFSNLAFEDPVSMGL